MSMKASRRSSVLLGKNSSARTPRRLQLESLESRTLMSASPSSPQTAAAVFGSLSGAAVDVAPAWFATVGKSAPATSQASTTDYTFHGTTGTMVSNQWLVKLNDAALKQAPTVSAAAKLLAPSRIDVVSGLGLSGWLLVRANRAGATAAAQEAVLRQNTRLATYEPNFSAAMSAVQDVVNDPYAKYLWGLNRIDTAGAWGVSQGDPNVVVAVIDSGVDWTHRDLAANIWTNRGEVPGNGIDDDRDGFVDDVRGWNFVANTNSPTDDLGHGTHVAGTIGAVANNGVGVAGVNQRVGILPVKVGDAKGITWANAARSINYVTMLKARGVNVSVINASWSGPEGDGALYDAIRAAGQHDILFVAAAGNAGTSNDRVPTYPANYDLDNVISVAATTSSDRLASYSSYGATTVDLAAPGSSIYSTLPGNRYGNKSGTSMAAPHVAGAAALAVAASPNKSLSVSTLRALLLNNVDRVTSLQGRVATGGRLNVARTVAAARSGGVLPALQVNDVQVQEGLQGDTLATFTVSLSAKSALPVSVQYATADGTARAADQDYASASGVLQWNAGETAAKTIQVKVFGDVRPEANENFFVRLSNPQNATLAKASGTATILNAVPPELEVADLWVPEGDNGINVARVVVTLTAPSAQTVTVQYATANNSALAGEDYEAASGTVTFAPGQTRQEIAVNLIGDVRIEPDESFFVQLTGASGVRIAKDQALVSIGNDDPWLTAAKPAVFRDFHWLLDLAGNGGMEERQVDFGLPGDTPIAGDWNGDGNDELWVVRYNAARGGLDWYLDLNADGYLGELVIGYGLPGDVPVAGDWNGDGRDELGVVRDNRARGGLDWYLDTGRDGFLAERLVEFGLTGDRPVAGDWNGDGRDDVGAVRENPQRGGLDWYFDLAGDGYLPEKVLHYGLLGDLPVPGDWNGDGADEAGIVRGDNTWWLDLAGNGDYAERVLQYGLPGDQCLSGNWGAYGTSSGAAAGVAMAAKFASSDAAAASSPSEPAAIDRLFALGAASLRPSRTALTETTKPDDHRDRANLFDLALADLG